MIYGLYKPIYKNCS